MGVLVHRLSELHKAQLSLKDGKVHCRGERYFVQLVNDKKNEQVYANLNAEAKQLVGSLGDKDSTEIPSDLVVLEITGDNGIFYQMGLQREPVRSYVQKNTNYRPGAQSKTAENIGVPNSLPTDIGRAIYIKSDSGIYDVVYLNRDILVIASRDLAENYLKHELRAPTRIIMWSDFASNA